MTRPKPGIKIPFFHESQYPIVLGFRCVEVKIPDDDAFMPLLAGLIKLAGRSFYYERKDYDKAVALAGLWKDAYDATDWDGCMNCEELQACIAPLLEAQNQTIQDMLNQSKYGDSVRPGQPMGDIEKVRDLAAGTNPTCDLDITWAQAVAIIDYQNTLIMDALEIAETATNDTELAEAISQIPGLDELGVDAFFGYISVLQDGISENYEAQFTAAYAEQAACDIFCRARVNCEISTQLIYTVFAERVAAYFDDPLTGITTIGDLMAYLLDQDIDGTIIADVMMLIVCGGGLLAHLFLGDVGTKKLETVLRLAVDDASSDWEILCDCPAAWEYDAGLADLEFWDDYLFADKGIWSPGNGWAQDDTGFLGVGIFGIATALPFECLSVRLYITTPQTGDVNLAVVGSLALDVQVADGMGTDIEIEVPVNTVINGLAVGYVPNSVAPGYPDFPGYTYRVVVTGFGYQPPELGG